MTIPPEPKNCCCAATTYAGVLGFWPINGMGPFNNTAAFHGGGGNVSWNFVPNSTSGVNPTAMDDIWPNVYKTLTVIMTHTTGGLAGQSATIVYQYQDYCDKPISVTVTTTPYFDYPYQWNGSALITPTFIQQGYSYPPGSVWGQTSGTGIFTATLSNQFNASTGWAGKTASALALVAMNVNSLPSPTTSLNTTTYYPVSSSSVPNYAGVNAGVAYAKFNLGVDYVCAAALGMPTRDPVWPPADTFPKGLPALKAIYDFDPPPSSPPGRNFGGVICLASNWVLSGSAPVITYSPATDHKTIYAQEFQLVSFAMGPILQPYPTFLADKTSSPTSDPYPYPNPIVPVLPVTFLPDDVLANLASGGDKTAQYGILGFNSIYTGAGQIYRGGFPPAGGAGGASAGAGSSGGAPPV